MKRIIIILTAVLMLVGCVAPQPQAYTDDITALNAVTLPKATKEDDYEAKSEIRQAVGENQLAGAMDFAARSAQAVLSGGDADENRLYSPMSLYFALAMLARTADGETRDQILSALQMADEATLDETASLYRLLYADDAYSRLHLANSAWTQQGGDIELDFSDKTLDTLAQKHFAEVFAVDFKSEKTSKAIDDWISKQTNGLLGSGFTTPDETLMMLVNTIYFKSEWASRFLEEYTAPANFHNADGSESQCDFMHKVSSQSFSRTEQYISSSLGLKGGSVRFILPNEGLTPEDILFGSGWAEVLSEDEGTGFGSVTWQVPKLDYSESVSLNDAAKALGIYDAFDPDLADFTPLTDSQLFVSSIHQQSTVTMDEKGIEAASYTDIAFAGVSMPLDTAEMILDRPYIFVIYAEGLPLFIGIVNAL